MKAFKILIIGLFTATAIWFVLCVFYLTCRRTIDAEIVNINNNIITIKDSTGNLWEIDNDSYIIGDKVVLTISDKGTDFLTDDEIIKIKKKDLTK